MKRNICIIIFGIISFVLFANDTYYYAAGGNIIPPESHQTNVEMVEEVIHIDLFDNYYSVTVDFTFFNHGTDENLIVGFPYLLQEQGGTYSIRIYDFKTWVNDEIVTYSNDKIELSGQGYGRIIVDHAFTKNVFFPSEEITKTKVEYKAEYGRASSSYFLATYYYGSGGAWHNPIGKMTIDIKNNVSTFDAWIYDIQMPEIGYRNFPSNIAVENHINWENNFLQMELFNIEPNENDTIAIWIGRPLWDLGPRVFSPNRFEYRTHMLEDRTLRLLSSQQLKITRNAFYAFYGYNFRDENLKSFFQSFNPSWYVVDESFNENMITEIERININKILEEERKR